MAMNNNYYNPNPVTPGVNTTGYGINRPTIVPQPAPTPAYNYAPVDPYYGQHPAQQQLVYVHGIDGANAYQLPQGVTKQILWDDDMDSFYIKAIDDMGRPRVIAWKDFTDHVIPPAQETQQAPAVDTSQFITKEDFAQMLNRLYVGERGKDYDQ